MSTHISLFCLFDLFLLLALVSTSDLNSASESSLEQVIQTEKPADGPFHRLYKDRSVKNNTGAPRYFPHIISSVKVGLKAMKERKNSSEYIYFVKNYSLGVAKIKDYKEIDLPARCAYKANPLEGVQVTPLEQKFLKKGGIVIATNLEGKLIAYNTFANPKPFQVIIVRKDQMEILSPPDKEIDKNRNSEITVYRRRGTDYTHLYKNILWAMSQHEIEQGDKIVILPSSLINGLKADKIIKAGKISIEALFNCLAKHLESISQAKDTSSKAILVAEIKDSVNRPPPMSNLKKEQGQLQPSQVKNINQRCELLQEDLEAASSERQGGPRCKKRKSRKTPSMLIIEKYQQDDRVTELSDENFREFGDEKASELKEEQVVGLENEEYSLKNKKILCSEGSDLDRTETDSLILSETSAN